MRATNVLILICIALTLYALYGADPTSVERNLAFSLKNMQEGRVWTLMTAIFRTCQPNPPTREYDLPLRFRQHFGECDEFETNAHCLFRWRYP